MRRVGRLAAALLFVASSFAIGWLAPTSSFAAGEITFEKIALMGEAAPGTEAGTVFAPFGFEYVPMVPTVDDASRVGFAAKLDGPLVDDSNRTGVWVRNGSVELAVRAGMPAPGPGGTVFRSFPQDFDLMAPRLGGGKIGVVASLSGAEVTSANDDGIWTGAPGSLALAGREGSQAPGLPFGYSLVSFLAIIGMSPSGHAMFSSSISGPGVTSANNEAFWTDRSGAWDVVLREGDQAPGMAANVVFGGAGQFIGTGYSFEFACLNREDEVGFQANIIGPGVTTFDNEALWVERNGELTLLAREGDDVPGMPGNVTFGGDGVTVDFGELSFNAPEQCSFTSRLGGNAPTTSALLSDHAGILGPVVLAGDPAPGTEEDFGIVGYQSLNDAGRIAFRAALSNGGMWPPLGIWWDQPGEPGEIHALVVPGQALPGHPGVTILAAHWIRGFNNAGQLLFEGEIDDPQSNPRPALVLAGPAGDLTLVVAAGEVFDVHGDGSDLRTVADFFTSDLSESGDIALRLEFTDGSFGIYSASQDQATGVGESALVSKLELHAAPNPFHSTTSLSFELARSTQVALTVYDAAGRRVSRLLDEPRVAGRHAVTWSGHDGSGSRVASGIYWVRLAADGESQTLRLVHLRP